MAADDRRGAGRRGLLVASSLPVLVGSVLVGTASAIAGALAVRAEKAIENEAATPGRNWAAGLLAYGSSATPSASACSSRHRY